MFLLIGLIDAAPGDNAPYFSHHGQVSHDGRQQSVRSRRNGHDQYICRSGHSPCAGSFGVFLCKQFYENFPRSLDEAAEIDGTNKWQTYFMIYLPNSKAILATLGLLKGVAVWNDYLWPLIMTNSENMKTVQLALTMFKQTAIYSGGK